MSLPPILERLAKEILILDGSMGALLQGRGLPVGYAPDLWNLEKADAIEQVHREYALAGSDILLTNTFGASRLRLAEYKAEGKLAAINRAAVGIARRASQGKCYLAGDIGPSGTTIAPFGELAFELAIELFFEQARELVAAGVDLIAIETMFDLQEMKACVIGTREATKGKIPILAHMTFTQDGLTDTGTDPLTAAVTLEGLGVDIIGANCSTGPEHMLPVVQKLGMSTSRYLCVQPNAGLPVQKNGVTIFPASAQDVAGYAERFADAGANIVGGCCGTTPEYIRLIRGILKPRKPRARAPLQGMSISSRTKTVLVGPGCPFLKIGEKINPTGRKKFGEAIAEGRTDLIVAEARKQFESGATALDVNVGVPMVNEAVMMTKAITVIQNVVDIPLVIDSSYTEALQAGLIVYPGKALVNSVNAEEERMEIIFPIVKKYGAAVIALVAESEIPEKAIDRLRIAEKILKRAEEFGVKRENIIFDCLALTVSAVQEAARQTLQTIRLIRQELGCPTSLGLSNVSFGLPNRHLVHNSFLAMAIGEGLDAAIVNPYDEEMHQVAAAASLFATRDPDCRHFISMQTTLEEKKAQAVDAAKPKTTRDELWAVVVEGNRDNVVAAVQKCLDEGMNPLSIFIDIMTPAIRHLGDLFGQRKKFIPHLVASADTMKRGVDLLKPLIDKAGPLAPKGVVIMATVKGDIHDIGKNICCIMLKNFGFRVVDLGRNVPMDTILTSAKEHKADIIGLSALMTTTMMQMKVVIDEVKKQGLPYKVMIGGAVTTRKFADEIHADGYGKDVGEVVTVAESLLEKKAV